MCLRTVFQIFIITSNMTGTPSKAASFAEPLPRPHFPPVYFLSVRTRIWSNTEYKCSLLRMLSRLSTNTKTQNEATTSALHLKDRCSFKEIKFSRSRFDSKKKITQDWNRDFHLRYTLHHLYTTKLILPATEKFSYIMQIKKKTKRKNTQIVHQKGDRCHFYK